MIVTRERYVHMQVELDLTPTAPVQTPDGSQPESLPTYGDPVTSLTSSQTPLQTAPTPVYTLQESRRIRGDNAQYFDHPQFGVIAHVSKIEVMEE